MRIRVEATEMAHGLSVMEKSDGWQHSNRNPNIRNKSRNFHVKSDFTRRPPGSGQPNRKPPCPCCSSPNHGAWACLVFQQKSYDDKWMLAKEKRLCMKSQTCQINGCRGITTIYCMRICLPQTHPWGLLNQWSTLTATRRLPHGRGQLAPLYHLRERTVMPRER